MTRSERNVQRITDWIKQECDYSFIYPGYSFVFKDEQLQLKDKELLQICAHCLSVPRYPLFYKCGHLTCLPCLVKYYRLCFNFQYKIRCPTCKQYSSLDDIGIFKEEKINHPYSVSMRMFNKTLFICSHAGCGQLMSLDMINQHELFECKQRRIHCPADRCSFVSRVEHVISHSVQCPFHIIYCGRCKLSYNDSVWKHECIIRKGKQIRNSNDKRNLQKRQSPPYHLHGDVILINHFYKNSFENYYLTQFNKFKSQARISTSSFSLLPISPSSGQPLRFIQRHQGIIDNRLQSPIQHQRLHRNLHRPHDDEDSASNFNFD